MKVCTICDKTIFKNSLNEFNFKSEYIVLILKSDNVYMKNYQI